MTFENIQLPITGLFWALCTMLGFYLLFVDNVQQFDKEDLKGVFDSVQDLFSQFFEAISSKLNFVSLPASPIVGETPAPPRNVVKGVAVILLVIATAYLSGLFLKSMAEPWMTKGSKNHLNMKFMWSSRKDTKDTLYEHVGDNIMKETFRDAYSNIAYDEKDFSKVREFYNYSRYKLINETGWKDHYNEIRQDMVNSSAFAFSFFTLMILALVNFILYTFRLLRSNHHFPLWGMMLLFAVLLVPGFFFVLWQMNYFSSLHCDLPLFDKFCDSSVLLLTVIMAVWLFALLGVIILILSTKISNYRLFVPLFVLLFAMGGYAVSGKAWAANRVLRDQYIFNTYKVRYDGNEGLRNLLKANLHVQEYIKHGRDTLLNKWPVTVDIPKPIDTSKVKAKTIEPVGRQAPPADSSVKQK